MSSVARGRGVGGSSFIVDEPGMGTVEVFPLPTSEEFLFALCREIFEKHWSAIAFGTLIQGAVYEIKAPAAPRKISLFDGYLTVGFGDWHFHICIGAHRGSKDNPTPPALAKRRRTSRAELYRCLDGAGAPNSWGLRLFNGAGEQQMTVFLPNPFLDEDDRIRRDPDWSRLALWDSLRKSRLGLDADPKDRSCLGFGGH